MLAFTGSEPRAVTASDSSVFSFDQMLGVSESDWLIGAKSVIRFEEADLENIA